MSLKIILAKEDVSELDINGECSGDWMAQSRYIYRLHNPHPEENGCILETHSRINLEFSKGGSVDCIISLTYIIGCKGKPTLMQLMDVAKQSFVKAQENFFTVIPFDGDKSKVWVYWTDDELASALSEQITKAF